MKRGLLLSVAFVYALFLSISAFAQDPEMLELTAPKIGAGLITIDGVADEAAWEEVSATTPEYVCCGGTNDAYPDASTFAATFKLAWSPEGMLIYVEVKDDVLQEFDADVNTAEYQWDNVEVFFYMPPD
jgi:hypothetical protein